MPSGETFRNTNSAAKSATAAPTITRSNVDTTAPPASGRGGFESPRFCSGWRVRSVKTRTMAARSRMPSVTVTSTAANTGWPAIGRMRAT